MPTPDDIRAGLSKAARDRQKADEAKERATAELRDWLRQVPDAEGLSMREAAELLGVSRVMAYRMLRGDRPAQ